MTSTRYTFPDLKIKLIILTFVFLIVVMLGVIPTSKALIDIDVKSNAISLTTTSGYQLKVGKTFKSLNINQYNEIKIFTDKDRGINYDLGDGVITLSDVTLNSFEFEGETTLDILILNEETQLNITSSKSQLILNTNEASKIDPKLNALLNSDEKIILIIVNGFSSLDFSFLNNNKNIVLEGIQFKNLSFDYDDLSTQSADHKSPLNSAIISGNINFVELDDKVLTLRKSEFLSIGLIQGYSSNIEVNKDHIAGSFHLVINDLDLNKGFKSQSLKPSILEWLYLNYTIQLIIIVFAGLTLFYKEFNEKKN